MKRAPIKQSSLMQAINPNDIGLGFNIVRFTGKSVPVELVALVIQPH
jgi:hypothetical protein